jgi:uncharacterized protein (DUF1810 family)
MMKDNLERFIKVQRIAYPRALAEITEGRKRSHWMWYIFPQIQGLGYSPMSKFYAIENIDEAAEYLNHPVLGARLVEISNALLKLEKNNATEIFGDPDDMKLKSSMTLFAALPGADDIFMAVLDKFFGGERDRKTLELIRQDE